MSGCERDPGRATALRRHACLALADAERSVGNADDLADIRRSFNTFEMTRQEGTVAAFHASQSTGQMQEPCARDGESLGQS